MFNVQSYLSEIELLVHFFTIVDIDTSSLLYYTRTFDTFILDSIANIHYISEVDIDLNSYSNYPFFNSLFYKIQNNAFTSFLICDVFVSNISEVYSLLFQLKVNYTDIYSISDYLDFFFLFLDIDINQNVVEDFIIFCQNSSIFSILNISVTVLSDWLYHFDVFLYFAEVYLVVFIFFLLFNSIKNFFITTKFYDSILTFFKQNNISFLEVTIVLTLYIPFVVFDTFASFSEDDNFDSFFYFILIFIVITFFFLSIAIDIQYFFTISNTSNGDVALRLLFFDILNNFLNILRIVLCWIRYIFYDLQVETIDFSFHYIDYSNENLFIYMFEEGNRSWSSSNDTTLSYVILMRFYFYYILFIFFDIVAILIQILLSIFKLLIAFYLLWLIVDLFVMRVLTKAESLFFITNKK